MGALCPRTPCPGRCWLLGTHACTRARWRHWTGAGRRWGIDEPNSCTGPACLGMQEGSEGVIAHALPHVPLECCDSGQAQVLRASLCAPPPTVCISGCRREKMCEHMCEHMCVHGRQAQHCRINQGHRCPTYLHARHKIESAQKEKAYTWCSRRMPDVQTDYNGYKSYTCLHAWRCMHTLFNVSRSNLPTEQLSSYREQGDNPDRCRSHTGRMCKACCG